jgi:hypothetical protein
MRYFPLLDFQYVVLLIFLGIASLIAMYLAFTYEEEDEGQEVKEEYPEGIRVRNGPVPLVLILLYLAFIIWSIVYVVVMGIKGQPL